VSDDQGLDQQATADEPLGTPEPAEQPKAEPRRTLWGVLLIILIIALVIFLLLLLRSCGGEAEGQGQQGGKSIEALPTANPVDGAVSVWIDGSVPIKRVLSNAHVVAIRIINMGRGRYVVDVVQPPPGRAARAIARQRGVYDAGLVYEP
jgi:hypothetical protein